MDRKQPPKIRRDSVTTKAGSIEDDDNDERTPSPAHAHDAPQHQHQHHLLHDHHHHHHQHQQHSLPHHHEFSEHSSSHGHHHHHQHEFSEHASSHHPSHQDPYHHHHHHHISSEHSPHHPASSHQSSLGTQGLNHLNRHPAGLPMGPGHLQGIQLIEFKRRRQSDHDSDRASDDHSSASTTIHSFHERPTGKGEFKSPAAAAATVAALNELVPKKRKKVHHQKQLDEKEAVQRQKLHAKQRRARLRALSLKGKVSSVGGKVAHLKSWVRKEWLDMSDISEDDRVDAIGEWDYWKGYYCPLSNPMYKKWRSHYFSWIFIMSIGQCSIMDLIFYINQYGLAFVVVTLLTYFGIGLPLYLNETLLGQYSGRKPLQLLRYLCPALTGLGALMYFRTMLLAIRSLAIFLYSMSFSLDFYFCKINSNQYLDHFFKLSEQNGTKFIVGTFTMPDIRNYTFIVSLSIMMIALFVTGMMTIASWGKWFRVGIQILCITQAMYFIVICIRAIDSTNVPDDYDRHIHHNHGNNNEATTMANNEITTNATGLNLSTTSTTTSTESQVTIGTKGDDKDEDLANTTIWSPTNEFFQWKGGLEILDGKMWIDSVLFVISSLSLGTLVHPYLGSRSFYHYRSVRDGIYLIFCVIFWNGVSLASILLWTNYVTTNERQVRAAFANLAGPHGLFVVNVMKFNQALLADRVESDVLFFCGILYTTIGASAFLALNGYIHILTHSSYPERTSVGLKLLLFLGMCILFAGIFPVALLSKEGLQYLVYVDYFANRCICLIVVTVGGLFWAMSNGHNLIKFTYDFRNMMHFAIFGADRVSAKYSRFCRTLATICIICILIYSTMIDQFPKGAGKTDYSGFSAFIGLGVCWGWCVGLVVTAYMIIYGWGGYTGRRGELTRPFRPHRDWFKNRFHYKACFETKHGNESETQSPSLSGSEYSETSSMFTDANNAAAEGAGAGAGGARHRKPSNTPSVLGMIKK